MVYATLTLQYSSPSNPYETGVPSSRPKGGFCEPLGEDRGERCPGARSFHTS